MQRTVVAVVALLVVGVLGSAAIAGEVKDPEAERAPTWQKDAEALRAEGDRQPSAYRWVGNNTVRIHGSNPYTTSVAISREMGWDVHNTFVVYLAPGQDYADALSLGPSVVPESGPMLLTTPNNLPAATSRELDRLRPCVIVAVGGNSAINRSVLEEADGHTSDCDY